MPIIDPALKEKIPPFLRNKFFMLFAAYFIYLLFFSQNTLISQSRLYMQLRDLEKEESYYKKEIATIKKEQRELFSGIDQMEKFARENYWMKRDSEDLYIFIESEK
ncbi:MAG TPA: septum formation initiator family protein [Chitinophagales bacterium]|nr:septum formation initiator family protein [Chitinophagales bacterium]HMY24545.1 septum formation initiator family protein [Chitinophagales bacterium]HMZ34042.1 septum formation initiator family protein [Chitinophagales bacterium]HNC72735.1 septum formation initiator family protein [Chitinophagales bacterium]HNF19616.1 septum formation initiator family protein [Chitinophagales bacterium]